MATGKVRTYLDSYIEVGFTSINDHGVEKPQCVICGEVFAASSMKRNILQRHLNLKHPAFSNRSKDYFERKAVAMKASRLDQTGHVQRIQEKLLEASFHVAYRIAKAKKPHTIAENLIMPCTKDIVRLLIGEDAVKKISGLPVSDNTIQRRIQAMSENIETQLVTQMTQSPMLAIALDESTDVASLSQLVVWVRYIHDDDFKDDLMLCKPLELTTKGADVFKMVDDFFTDKELNWNTVYGSCTDGAPAMLGVRSGFKAKINEVAPNVFSVHCMIHREALAAKTLPDILKNVMQQVIRMVNHIKSSALNTRLFRKFCRGMDADHINLLYYTEVRWLSRGNMMQRVYELRTEMRDFLQGQKKDDWANLLNDKEWLAKLSYLSDIFERLNTLNRSLQGKGSNIMEFHDKLEGFLGVIDLLIRKVRADRYALFPSLSEFIESENFEVANLKEPIEEHLLSLKSEFDRYFPDIDTEQFAFIRNPFDAVENFDDDDEPAEAELIEMRADNCAKDVFSRSPLSTFWCTMRHGYPNLAKIALKKLLPYPSTYLCESSFSTMTAMKTKSRNRLELEHDFRVCVSTTEPEISKLVRDAKNPQVSH
jgi:hypothetical protein